MLLKKIFVNLPSEEHQQKPRSGHGEHQNSFFHLNVAANAVRDAGQNEKIGDEEDELSWIVRL